MLHVSIYGGYNNLVPQNCTLALVQHILRTCLADAIGHLSRTQEMCDTVDVCKPMNAHWDSPPSLHAAPWCWQRTLLTLARGLPTAGL